MPLESDTINADSQLDVTFYDYQGEDQFKGVLHVRIITPGNKDNIIDRVAREDDKQRFQRQWLHYQMKNSDSLAVGTTLSQWRAERPEELTVGQMEELHILKFMTVEQLAMAADAHIARIGMGGAGLRLRARSYLASKNERASSLAIDKANDEIAMLKAAIERLSAAQAAPAPAPEKSYRAGAARRGGKRRPAKKPVSKAPAPEPVMEA